MTDLLKVLKAEPVQKVGNGNNQYQKKYPRKGSKTHSTKDETGLTHNFYSQLGVRTD